MLPNEVVSACTAGIFLAPIHRIVVTNLIRSPIFSRVIDKAESITTQGWDLQQRIVVREVALNRLPQGMKPLIETKWPAGTNRPPDIENRWFIVVDGGHRLCAMLLLWYSGYPGRQKFEWIEVILLDHRKCFIKVSSSLLRSLETCSLYCVLIQSVANDRNTLSSTSSPMNTMDRVTTMLAYWNDYTEWIRSENTRRQAEAAREKKKKPKALKPSASGFALQSHDQEKQKEKSRKNNDGGWLRQMGFSFSPDSRQPNNNMANMARYIWSFIHDIKIVAYINLFVRMTIDRRLPIFTRVWL
jgi:hypothetical protein